MSWRELLIWLAGCGALWVLGAFIAKQEKNRIGNDSNEWGVGSFMSLAAIILAGVVGVVFIIPFL